MSVNLGVLDIVLKLRDEFSSQFERTATKIDAIGARIDKIGGRMAGLGSQMTMLTAPILAVGAAAVKVSLDFSETLTQIETLVGLTHAQVQGAKDDILRIAHEAGRMPKEVAEGFYFLTSAGLDVKQSLDAVAVASKAATLGLGDVPTLADAASSAMNAYGAKNLDASKALNILALAVRAGKFEASGFAPVMGQLIPTASLLKVRFEDVNGVLAAMSRTMGKDGAAEAAVSLNQFMTGLLHNTKEANEVLAQAGLTNAMLRDVISQPGGLVEAMRMLQTGLAKVGDEALNKAVPNVRAFRAVANVLAQDSKQVDDVMRQVASGVDLIGDGMKTVAGEPGFKFKQFLADANIQLLKMGDQLIPTFRTLLDIGQKILGLVSSVTQKFAGLSESNKKLVINVIAVGVALGPVLYVLGNFLKMLGTLIQIAPAVAAAIRLMFTPLGGIITLLITAGIYVNSLINKWKEASEAATKYYVAQGNVEGRALSFAKTVKSGGVVSKSAYEQATKDLADLRAGIEETEKRANQLKGTLVDADPSVTASNKDKLDAIQADLKAKQQAYERLRESIAKARVEEEKPATPPGTPPGPPKPRVPFVAPIDEESLKKYNRLVSEIENKIKETRKVITAYETEGVQAGERVAQSAEDQAAAFDKASEFTGTYRDTIFDLQKTLIALEHEQENAAKAASLNVDINDRYRLSLANTSVEMAQVRRNLELEAAVREAVGTATGKQATHLAALAKIKYWQDEEQARKEAILSAKVETASLEDLLASANKGSAVFNRLADSQALEAKILAKTLELHGKMPATLEAEMRKADALSRQLSTLNDVMAVLGQADLAINISGISESNSRLRQIETDYLGFLSRVGRGSVEEGRKVLDDLSDAVLSATGVFVDFGEQVRGAMSAIYDAQLAAKVQGFGKSPLESYKEERAEIERLMYDSTSKVKIDVESGQAYINDRTQKFWTEQASAWQSAFSYLGNLFGGFFRKLAQAVSNVQAAYQTGSNLGASIGGAGSALSGAAGGIFAVFQIFYEVYNAVSEMLKKQRAAKMGAVTSLTVKGGEISSPEYFNQAGKEVSASLRKLVIDIADSVGGILKELPQIAIRARHDGKAFSVYVASVFVGTFKDAQSAMEAGVAQAISMATFAGVSAEIAQALKKSIGLTLDEVKDNIQTATNVRNARLGDTGAQYMGVVDSARAEIEAARRLGLATDDLIKKRDRETAAIKNQALGIDTSASDRLESLASLNRGIGEAADSTRAQLQQWIEETRRQLAALLARPGSSGGGAGSGLGGNGAGPIQPGQIAPGSPEFSGGLPTKEGGADSEWDQRVADLRRKIDDYIAQLDKIPAALSDQEINMGVFDTLYSYLQGNAKYAKQAQEFARERVKMEFDLIKLKLIELNRWEQFQDMFNDAFNAAMAAAGKTGHKGGGKGSDKESIQSFIDDKRFQLSLNGMDDYHQRLAQLNRDYQEQIKAAGKDAKLKAELLALQQQETRQLAQQNRKDVTTKFNELVNPEDQFGQLKAKFNAVRDSIKGAGFGADRAANMLSRLASAEALAAKKLSDQLAAGLLGDLANVITASDTNAKQNLLHNQLLRAQETINFQLRMVELHATYEMLKAQGLLAPEVVKVLQDAFGWIDANRDVLPGGSKWVPSFEAVTSAADNLDGAASNLSDSANRLKSALQGLVDYQKSLRTDASQGMVDSRTALINSQNEYQSLRAKALTGDLSAIEKIKDAAETYRRNLVDFSPSSGLTANVLRGIDDTITKILDLPGNRALLLSPDGQATVDAIHLSTSQIVGGLSMLGYGFDAKSTKDAETIVAGNKDFSTQLSQLTHAKLTDIAVVQQKTADETKLMREDLRVVAGAITLLKTQTANDNTETHTILDKSFDTLQDIERHLRKAQPAPGVGG